MYSILNHRTAYFQSSYLYPTSSFAVAEKPRDALCLSS